MNIEDPPKHTREDLPRLLGHEYLRRKKRPIEKTHCSDSTSFKVVLREVENSSHVNRMTHGRVCSAVKKVLGCNSTRFRIRTIQIKVVGPTEYLQINVMMA